MNVSLKTTKTTKLKRLQILHLSLQLTLISAFQQQLPGMQEWKGK